MDSEPACASDYRCRSCFKFQPATDFMPRESEEAWTAAFVSSRRHSFYSSGLDRLKVLVPTKFPQMLNIFPFCFALGHLRLRPGKNWRVEVKSWSMPRPQDHQDCPFGRELVENLFSHEGNRFTWIHLLQIIQLENFLCEANRWLLQKEVTNRSRPRILADFGLNCC